MTTTDARLREIVERCKKQLATSAIIGDKPHVAVLFKIGDIADLLSALADALQPEPECECMSALGPDQRFHQKVCPVTVYRQRRAARLRIIQEGE